MSASMTSRFALEGMLARAMDGVFVLDRDRRFVMFNGGCRRITGYAEDEVLGAQCPCHSTVACRDEYGRSLSGSLCPGLNVLRGLAPGGKQRMQIRRKDGAMVWVESTYTPIQDESGAIECVLGVMRDITDTREREAVLREAVSSLRETVARLRKDLAEQYGFSNVVARSPRMQMVFDQIRTAATNPSAVLISGEAGTGKELVARAIHETGLQKDGPFVAFNCSAAPADQVAGELFGYRKGARAGATTDFAGLFRAADHGTILLDEVLEMPADVQARLLQALEDGRIRAVDETQEVPIDVRVIAATSRSVADALQDGRLRRDLYYRLGITLIELPPLRDRREDIPILVTHKIEQCNAQSLRQVKEVDDRVWDFLLSYDWPGNVRELQNAVETAFATGHGDTLSPEHLPGSVRGDTVEVLDGERVTDLKLDDALRRIERKVIEAALRRAGRQRSRAAQLMGISRSRLYRRMEALGVDPNQES